MKAFHTHSNKRKYYKIMHTSISTWQSEKHKYCHNNQLEKDKYCHGNQKKHQIYCKCIHQHWSISHSATYYMIIHRHLHTPAHTSCRHAHTHQLLYDYTQTPTHSCSHLMQTHTHTHIHTVTYHTCPQYRTYTHSRWKRGSSSRLSC